LYHARLAAIAPFAFDADDARHLEALYRTRDIRRRRLLVHAALNARPGERILDAGCGPGFFAAELLDRVGERGFVIGVDASPQMLAAAAGRCADFENVALREGQLTALPVDDASVDAALCVQVLEYVPDATAALAELRRAVRPGGRVVVWDTDWTAVSWYSADPARMRRVLQAWDAHLVHPALPQTLAARMREAGLDDVRAEGHVFHSDALDPETFGGAIVANIERFVGSTGEVAPEELAAWGSEQRDLDERGCFSFSSVQFCFTATRRE
jgi:arsenite methyltransferase